MWKLINFNRFEESYQRIIRFKQLRLINSSKTIKTQLKKKKFYL